MHFLPISSSSRVCVGEDGVGKISGDKVSTVFDVIRTMVCQ